MSLPIIPDNPRDGQPLPTPILNSSVRERQEFAERMVALRPALLGQVGNDGLTFIERVQPVHFIEAHGERGEHTALGYRRKAVRRIIDAVQFIDEEAGQVRADLIIETIQESRRKSGLTGKPHNPAERFRHLRAGGTLFNPSDDSLKRVNETHAISAHTDALGPLALPINIAFVVDADSVLYRPLQSDTRPNVISIADIEVALLDL